MKNKTNMALQKLRQVGNSGRNRIRETVDKVRNTVFCESFDRTQDKLREAISRFLQEGDCHVVRPGGLLAKTVFGVSIRSKVWPLFFLLACSSLLAVGATDVSAGEVIEIKEYDDFAEAQAAAKEANLPILIDFYTDWCKYCKQMDTATFTDPKVITWLNENVIFAKIDSEDENKDRTAFAESYGVRGYPTFALVRADGSELDRAVGFLDAEHFITTFTEYKNDQNTLNDFLRRLDKQPSAKLHYDIGEKLRWRGKSAEAEAHFASAISLDKDNSAGIAADCKWSLADLARRDKNYPAAIKRYKDLIASFPDYEKVTDAHLYVGLCLRDAGQRQEAIAQFERFKALFPDSEDVEYADKKIKQIKEDIEGS